MNFKDLREFILFLEDKGELRRIKTRVSSELEITEIANRVIDSGGPALLFENVEGFDMPVLINMYGSHQRMAWALGVEKLDDIVARYEAANPNIKVSHEPIPWGDLDTKMQAALAAGAPPSSELVCPPPVIAPSAAPSKPASP